MVISNNIREKLDRLYCNEYLGPEEIKSLEKWLESVKSDPDFEEWLRNNWESATQVEFKVSFESIQTKIRQHNRQSKIHQVKHWISIIQKAAAILLIPVLVFSVWQIVGHSSNSSAMTVATAKGEHTHIFLPDGSEVWLNVDSRLQYSTDYHATNRLLKLKGEALFKVAKDKKHPFIVDARGFKVKAVGTMFSVSNYDEEAKASTYLKEGIVELSYSPKDQKEQKIQMVPGEQAIISLGEESVKITKTGSDNSLRWSAGELYFENEPMDQVFRKVERWYNVKIQYNLNDFTSETLTVNLKKGESIERLFQIINQAMGINVNIKGEEYVITRK